MPRLCIQVTEPRGHGTVLLIPRIYHLLLQYTLCIILGIVLVTGNMQQRTNPRLYRLRRQGREAAVKYKKHTANGKQPLSSSCVPDPVPRTPHGILLFNQRSDFMSHYL